MASTFETFDKRDSLPVQLTSDYPVEVDGILFQGVSVLALYLSIEVR